MGSFEIFWFGGPVWAARGPKVFKISHKVDYVNQKPYQLKFFGLGAPLGLLGAPKCQNFKNFVFQARSFKISLNIDHVNQKSYYLNFFWFGCPVWAARGPKVS